MEIAFIFVRGGEKRSFFLKYPNAIFIECAFRFFFVEDKLIKI